jgi:hypothetical protein
MALQAARGDALAGLSLVVAELCDGSVRGTLDRLKMCAAGNRMKTRTYRERHRGAGLIVAKETGELDFQRRQKLPPQRAIGRN